MRVLLTGGAGFIGSHTAVALVEAGHTPVIDHAVDTLLNGVYLKYEKNEQQDAYFAAATAAVFDAITKPNVNAKALGEGLSKAAYERRIMLWSAEPDIQKELAGTAIAHELSSGPSERPQIGFYLSDVSAAKIVDVHPGGQGKVLRHGQEVGLPGRFQRQR